MTHQLKRMIKPKVIGAAITLFALLATFYTAALAQQTPAPGKTTGFSAPASVRLTFDVQGSGSSSYSANAELAWQREESRYSSQLTIRKFGLPIQVWSSNGAISSAGLEPLRFDSKRLGGKEVSANFIRAQKLVVFTANTPDAPLRPGAQDQLSVFMQLAGLLSGGTIGTNGAVNGLLAFQAVGDRYAENWDFQIGSQEQIVVPGGSFSAWKLTHHPTAERHQKLELWYASSLGNLPIRIRITEENGDSLDMRWVESTKY